MLILPGEVKLEKKVVSKGRESLVSGLFVFVQMRMEEAKKNSLSFDNFFAVKFQPGFRLHRRAFHCSISAGSLFLLQIIIYWYEAFFSTWRWFCRC